MGLEMKLIDNEGLSCEDISTIKMVVNEGGDTTKIAARAFAAGKLSERKEIIKKIKGEVM